MISFLEKEQPINGPVKTLLRQDRMRNFFIDVLHKQKLDPSVPSNWYLISPSLVRSIKVFPYISYYLFYCLTYDIEGW